MPDTSSNGHFLNQTLPQNGQFLNWGNVWLRKCPFEEVSESSCIFVAVICMRKTVFQLSCFLVGNIWRMILHGSLAIFLLNPKVPYFGQYRVSKEGFREDLSSGFHGKSVWYMNHIIWCFCDAFNMCAWPAALASQERDSKFEWTSTNLFNLLLIKNYIP